MSATAKAGARAALLLVAVAAGCAGGREQQARTMSGGGEPSRGRDALRSYGCSSCHAIPGVPGATAAVGPALADLVHRSTVAGDLPNSADALIRWIRHPQRHRPGTLMPELNVTDGDARDIVAYLYAAR